MQSVFQNGWKINQNSTIEEKPKGKKEKKERMEENLPSVLHEIC